VWYNIIMSRKKQKAPVRNPIQVASLARYPRTQPHTNKRDKRAHEDKRWTRFKEEGLGMVTKREFEALVDNLVSEWQKVHLDRYTSDDPSMAALGYHAWGSQVNGAANDLEARLYELIDDVAAKLANGDYHQPSDRDWLSTPSTGCRTRSTTSTRASPTGPRPTGSMRSISPRESTRPSPS
jgi:hypothetical protein